MQDLEYQLDDAVAFKRGQSDQFAGGSHHDPEGGVRKEVHRRKDSVCESSADCRFAYLPLFQSLPFEKLAIHVDYIDEQHGFMRKREAKAQFREQILKGWDYKCAYCREPLGKSGTLDHVRPKAKGGETIFSNLVACCLSCNTRKSSNRWDDWFRVQDFWEPHLEDAIRYWLNQ